MSFYHYRQNNSGGSFDFDAKRGISVNVWVEADSAGQADGIAESIGIYFDGCDSGLDCPCCGDRWDPAWDKPTDVPEVYGGPALATWDETQAEAKRLYDARPEHEKRYGFSGGMKWVTALRGSSTTATAALRR